MSYVASAGAPDAPCVFCSLLAAGDDRRALMQQRDRIHRARTVDGEIGILPGHWDHLSVLARQLVAPFRPMREPAGV